LLSAELKRPSLLHIFSFTMVNLSVHRLTLVILPRDEVNVLDGIARTADRQANPNRWIMVMERA